MPRTARAPDAPVTGVASGSLGTDTALDDTQVYALDDLTPAGDAPGEDAGQRATGDAGSTSRPRAAGHDGAAVAAGAGEMHQVRPREDVQ